MILFYECWKKTKFSWIKDERQFITHSNHSSYSIIIFMSISQAPIYRRWNKSKERNPGLRHSESFSWAVGMPNLVHQRRHSYFQSFKQTYSLLQKWILFFKVVCYTTIYEKIAWNKGSSLKHAQIWKVMKNCLLTIGVR